MVLRFCILGQSIAAVWLLTMKVAFAQSSPTSTKDSQPIAGIAESSFDERVARAKWLMIKQRYESALVEWKSAYALWAQPWLLVEQARCERLLGNGRSASEPETVQEMISQQPESAMTKPQSVSDHTSTEKTDRSSHQSLVLIDIAKDDNIQFLSIGSATCEPPCQLQAQRGPQLVIGTGSSTFVSHLLVNGPGKVRIVSRSSYRIAGMFLIPSGIVLAASLWALGFLCPNGGSDACPTIALAGGPALGLGLLFTGLGLLGYSRSAPIVFEQYEQSSRASIAQGIVHISNRSIEATTSGAIISSTLSF